MPYATSEGLRIYYEIAGAGPPLLLHHGLTGSWRDWEEFGFLDGLQDDYQLIMLDARGHGASDKPHDPAAYGFERGVADVVAVLDDLGIDRAHYYGQRGLESDAAALAATITLDPAERFDDSFYAESRCHLAASQLRDATIVEIPNAQPFTLYADSWQPAARRPRSPKSCSSARAPLRRTSPQEVQITSPPVTST